MITVSGKSGVRVGTKKAYRAAAGKPRMFVVTKLDDENANFYNVLTDLKSTFGPSVCPVVVPVIVDRKVDSYINLIEMKHTAMMQTARRRKSPCRHRKYLKSSATV